MASTKISKIFYEYQHQSWLDVKKALVNLALVKISHDTTAVRQIQRYAQALVVAIEANENKVGTPLLPIEKQAIKLIDIDLVQQCTTVFQSQNFIIEKSDDEAMNQLLGQLALVAAVIGFGFNQLIPYTLEEFKDYLKDAKKYDACRIIRTLREHGRDEDRKELVENLINFLKNSEQNKKQYNWDELLFFILELHIIFNRFPRLTTEQQIFMLQNYFYQAIVIGAPIRTILEQTLIETRTPFSYILINKNFWEALDSSKETASINYDGRGAKPLSQIFQEYKNETGTDWTNEKKQQIFSNKIYNLQQHRGLYSEWLREALYIYCHLEVADLVDHNRGAELTEAELYGNDVIQLLAWFGVGMRAGGDQLIKYFKQQHHRVPLSSFLRELIDVADLSKSETVENVSELTELLQENNLFPTSQELIEFHESDGQFHWNEK